MACRPKVALMLLGLSAARLAHAQPVPANSSDAPPATAPAPAASAGAPDSAPQSAQSEESRALRAELEELKAQMSDIAVARAESDAFERRFELYGFVDMGFQRVWSSPDAATTGTGQSRALTFVLGNVNLYFDASPLAGWRSLTEIRLTNYPNGMLTRPAVPSLAAAERRESSTVFDLNAPDPGWNEVSWSGLVLEQAWIQGTLSDWFGVRAGYFLTPFGIWNIDHGTPTLIALSRPQFTRGRFYPEHQLGLQVLGQTSEGSWTLGYVGYVSNGKTQGPIDYTDDKAFGGRLSAATTRPVRLALGLAGYTGRYSEMEASVEALSALSLTQNERVAYRQWDFGADVSLDVGSLRVRSEVAVERIDYEPGKRDAVFDIPGTAWPDRSVWGWYLLAAYQLPWFGLEPYLSGELYRYPTPLSEAAVIPGAGLNVHFAPEVQLKSQFSSAHFFDFDGDDHGQHDTSTFASRLVLAF